MRGRKRDKLHPEDSAIDKMIAYFGGVQETAWEFKISVQCVYVWRKQKYMPFQRCLEAEELTENVITFEELNAESNASLKRKFENEKVN